MKSVYFFAGNWRFPVPAEPFYDSLDHIFLTPASNDCLYALHPLNAQHLGWSESPDNRLFAVNTMLAAGVNVVNMSYWGPAGDDVWAWYAPMQTAIGAHNELFDVAVGRPLLIIPTIEEAGPNTVPPVDPMKSPQGGCYHELGPVGHSSGYSFKDDFPGSQTNPAPGLVLRIEDLIYRYLKNPEKPEWADKWAKMYDQNSMPRYVIHLLHVGSDRLGGSSNPDADFAMGFAWVEQKVWQDTGGNNGGIHVGFVLDVVPADSPDPNAPIFKATPELTGQYLVQYPSFLAIQAFIPEINTGICNRAKDPSSDCDQVAGSSALDSLISWKRDFIQRWVTAGSPSQKVPVILDVAPGYDGHVIFKPVNPGDADNRYGNNDPWRNAQSGFLSLGVVGLVGNTWNGFTEGYALMPACGTGTPPGLLCSPDNIYPEDVNSTWFRNLNLIPLGGSPAKLPTAITSVGPASGTYSDAVTLTAKLMEALRDGPSGTTMGGSPITGRTVHFKVGSQSVDGTTDANGTATATITLNQQPTTVERLVSFAGDNTYLSLFVKDEFVIAREPTVLHYTGTQAIANGGAAILSALLTDDDGRPLGGKSVGFTLGAGASAQSCTGITDATGNAGCQLSISQVLGPQTISMSFAGDAYYEPSSITAAIVVFSYLPAGSFVIADRAAQAGANVLFWGDTWAQANQPSAGPAPLSFKGFGNDVGGYPPRCGVNWSTTTGNSPPPPAGPLPSYMAVAVASRVNKVGSIVVGNTQRIVVVQTKPGYAPDPSHPGTGTIVATVCGP